MITVISRPLGHKLTDAELAATVTTSSGEALFNTLFAHGLQTGDYVYVESNIESYNGYKYVIGVSYNGFKLKDSEGGDYVPFKQAVDVSYRISVLAHGWLAVNNPIVYELSSDLWPNNIAEEAYTPVTIVSQQNVEGYTQLNLSTGISGLTELNFIELVGTGSLAGPYQIVTVVQPWAIIINLAYSASNDFSGYQVVNYYNNYCINVEIWVGLDTNHPWYSEKPYELAATLRFTPDGDGHAKFSISDIVKGYIETRNNLTLDTLPNNLDFWTGFYIKYYETYDDSDGEEITTQTGTMFSDKISFEGHAVNADMAFKSLYISHMSEYINEDTYYAKWLILQTNPVVIVGYYFDLSFLNTLADRDILIHLNGEVTRIENPGIGVLRVPIEPLTAGQLCVTAYSDVSTQEVPAEELNLSSMSNSITGNPWVLGTQPSNDNPTLGTAVLKVAKLTSNGASLKVNYTITVSNWVDLILYFSLMTTPNTLNDNQTISPAGNGIFTGSVTIVATDDRNYFGIYGLGNFEIAINSISFGDPTTVEVPGVQITEQLCLTVLEECDDTIVGDDDIRLTEDGDFRILE